MSADLTSLLTALGMNPALSEVVALVSIVRHLEEARKITSYSIGRNTYPISKIPSAITPAHISLAEHHLLDFYLSARGHVTEGNVTYDLDSERYFWRKTNTASVNGNAIPGGLVIHLDSVAPDVSTNIGAKVVIAYIFNATHDTPQIALLAETTIGLLKKSART